MVCPLKWRRKSLRWVCFFNFILNSIEFQSRSIFCSGAENSKETATLKVNFTHCIHSTTNFQLRNKWQKFSPKINVLNAGKGLNGQPIRKQYFDIWIYSLRTDTIREADFYNWLFCRQFACHQHTNLDFQLKNTSV